MRHLIDMIDHSAIKKIHPETLRTKEGAAWDQDGKEIEVNTTKVAAEKVKLLALESQKQLRLKRNRLLTESDWTGLVDTALTAEQSAKFKLYRQKLRDLPSGASPSLDNAGELVGVTWPEKPE